MNYTMKKVFNRLWTTALGLLLIGSVSAAETITYFHNDIVGSPLAATDQSGNVVWKESYHPYGEQLQKQASSANNHLWFADKSFEQSSGLSYSGARYYDPMLGRFMGMDPVDFKDKNIQSFNRYAYGNNSPYKFIDPDGRDNIVITGGGAAVALPAGADANTGFGYNVESHELTRYITTGSGAGLDSGFAGLMVGGGMTFSYIKGDSKNVGGVFDNNSVSLPIKWPLGVAVYRSPDGKFQGIGISVGPGIGAGRTKTNTEMKNIINPLKDQMQRANDFGKEFVRNNSG